MRIPYRFRTVFNAAIASVASFLPAAISGAQTIPSGGVSLVDEADIAIDGSFWQGNGPVATRSIVPVSGQSFSQAARIDVLSPTGQFWDSSIGALSNRDVATSDVILLHVFLKAVQTTYETGSVFCHVYVEGPAPDYTKSLSQDISATSEWTEYFLPFEVVAGQPAGDLRVFFGFGAGDRAQTLDIGGAEILWYGTSRTLAEMPRTSFQYDGRDPDAAWREEARQRIERYRKSEFDVCVVNADGLPVENASVRVRMKKHAFAFSTAIQSARIVDQTDPDNQQYLAVLLDLFNAAGPENDLKWPAWIGEWGSDFNQPQTLAALSFLKSQGFYLRGHVLVWPSERNLPQTIGALLPSADPAIPGLILDHIDDVVDATKDYLSEWDVINEPFDNHDLMDLFGNDVMVDWFNEARLHHPTATLFINDYAILSAGGTAIAHQDHYEQTIQLLVDNDAPIGGIGFQGHFDSSPTGIPKVWQIMERFSASFPDLVFKITEFDVDTDDEELQADYTRDFLTIAFSHPQVKGFQVWGFAENAHWRPRAAMFRSDWTEKPNGTAFRQLIQNEWWTDKTLRTNADGRVNGRGFLGDYEIEVDVNGQVVTASQQLGENGMEAQVVIDVPVAPEPRITVEPLGVTVSPGESASLSFSASGLPVPTITWYRNGVALNEHGLVLEITAAGAGDEATYYAEVTNSLGTVRTRDVQIGVRALDQRFEKLTSISTRGLVLTGEQVMIGGFYIVGTGDKELLIRGVGPRLANLGVVGVLADPFITLHRLGQSVPLLQNDNWDPSLAPLFAQLGAFGLGTDTLSAAIHDSLPPGGYTVTLSAASGSSGVGIVEVWDVANGAPLDLVSISTRGQVGTGERILIAGINIAGEAPKQVLIRGIGPGLTRLGVQNALEDPFLSLHEFLPGGGSRQIAVNNDWGTGQDGNAVALAASEVHAFAVADFSADAGLLLYLEPGSYSIQLSGADGGTGVALIEAYAVP